MLGGSCEPRLAYHSQRWRQVTDVGERVPSSLSDVLRRAGEFPRHLLPHGGTALAFFSAGFWGWNDVIYLQQADMTATCVDTDKDKLWQMAELYPEGWSFHVDDAWHYAECAASEGLTWDVVTIDPWTQTIPKALEDLPLWCSLANDLVVIGCFIGEDNPPIPDGWTASVLARNERVGWLVLVRA